MRVEELVIDTGALPIALKRWGDASDPVVIALHGWLDNAGSFDVIAPKLTGVQLLALDLPGHGQSGHRPPGAQYCIWSYLEDFLSIADGLGLEKVSLLGHSMGGAIACLLAAVYPERVNSLALLDSVGPLSTPVQEAPVQMRRALEALSGIRPARHHADREQAVKARARHGVEMATAEILSQRGVDCDDDGFFWNSDRRLSIPSIMRMDESQVSAFMKSIQCRVLLVAAEPFWRDKQDLFKQRISYLRHLELESLDGSHHQHLEGEASVIADRLNAFWG